MQHRARETVYGSLLGGAIGDALGAPLEFLCLDHIRKQFGPEGIQELAPLYGRLGAVTDDTQMTLFTAEGLILAANRGLRDIRQISSIVHHAYLDWLRTQGEHSSHPAFVQETGGWLLQVPELHNRRGPGHTCLSALRSSRMGTLADPINESKGCGTVMRIAPVGLIRHEDPFRLGCEIAAITHGHPTGQLAAGFLAHTIACIADGATLDQALDSAIEQLVQYPSHAECLKAIRMARQLAQDSQGTAEHVESLGEGWIAEEALSIALFCSLVAQDFCHGLRLAVNHSGDSDSTGALTGNILGALLGLSAIPQEWLSQLELRSTIERIAEDILRCFWSDEISV